MSTLLQATKERTRSTASNTSAILLTVFLILIPLFYKRDEVKKLPFGEQAHERNGVGATPFFRKNAPRLPGSFFTARDDEHSDWKGDPCNGNGCCDGVAPYFPHPRPTCRAVARSCRAEPCSFILCIRRSVRRLYYKGSVAFCQESARDKRHKREKSGESSFFRTHPSKRCIL